MTILLPEALRPVWDALEKHGEYELARVLEQEVRCLQNQRQQRREEEREPKAFRQRS